MMFKANPQEPLWRVLWQPTPWNWSTLTSCTWSWKKRKEENVLMVINHFTKYAEAHVTWSETTQATAKVFLNSSIVHYGLPEKIISNHGRILKVH